MTFNKTQRFQLGDWQVDCKASRLEQGEEHVPLPALSLALLLALIEHEGELVSADELIRIVWAGQVVSDETLQQRVKLLRRALGDDSDKPRYIANVRGKGYRLLLRPLAIAAAGTVPKSALAQSGEPLNTASPPPLPVTAGDGVAGKPARRSTRHRHWALILIAVMLLTGTMFYLLSESTAPLDPHRIAVLPMVRLSPLAEDDYLADGLTEQLIQALSRYRELQVIARSSVQHYRGQTPELTEVAKELTVGSVLEGSLQRDGEQLHITVTLVDVTTRQPRWSRNFAARTGEWFAVEQSISNSVAEALQAHLLLPTPVASADSAANELYMQGRTHYFRYTRDDNTAAITLFRASLAKDPTYALALSGLSDALAQASYQFNAPLTDAEEALRYAEAALALQPDLVEAHKAKGLALDLLGRYREAIASYRAAIVRHPNYLDAEIDLAALLLETGQYADAMQLLDSAERLDPVDPVLHLDQGQLLGNAGFKESALQRFNQVVAQHPDYPMAQFMLAQYWFNEGNWTASEKLCQQLLAKTPDYSPAIALSGDAALFSDDRAHAESLYLELASGDSEDSHYARLRLGLSGLGGEQSALFLQQERKYWQSRRQQSAEDPGFLVQLAMLAEKDGDPSSAQQLLMTAMAAGWRDYNLLKHDPALTKQQALDGYNLLVSRIEKAQQTQRQRMLQLHPDLR